MLPLQSGPIQAYSDDGARAKANFLKAAASHARRIAKAWGKTAKIKKNAGGIAVSGEVYAYFTLPHGTLLIEIGQSSGTTGNPFTGGPMGFTREDGVFIRAVMRHAAGGETPNAWIDPSIVASDCVEFLENISRDGRVF